MPSTSTNKKYLQNKSAQKPQHKLEGDAIRIRSQRVWLFVDGHWGGELDPSFDTCTKPGHKTPILDPGISCLPCNFCNFDLACPSTIQIEETNGKKTILTVDAKQILSCCIQYPKLDVLCLCLPMCYAVPFVSPCEFSDGDAHPFCRMCHKNILTNKMILFDQINLKILYVGFSFKN